MPRWIDEEALTAPPLTAEEKAWITKLDNLLKVMPSRFKILEAADTASIIDWDAAKENGGDLCDGGAGQMGVELAILVHGSFKITGVAA